MSRKIVVDPAKLTAASKKMLEILGEYNKQYMLLYSEVEGMGAAWKGKDNTAFVERIAGFKDDFEKMKSILTEYSNFLDDSATRYNNTQTALETQARKLTN